MFILMHIWMCPGVFSMNTCTLWKPVSPAAATTSATRYIYDFQHHRDPFQAGCMTLSEAEDAQYGFFVYPKNLSSDFQTKPNCEKWSIKMKSLYTKHFIDKAGLMSL